MSIGLVHNVVWLHLNSAGTGFGKNVSVLEDMKIRKKSVSSF